MAAGAPDWIGFDADKTEGLDLLGLRAPVQRIGNELFDGITTVTPKIRYLSVLSWIVHRYTQAGLPDSWPYFLRFAEAQEAMIVLANRILNRPIRNLVGVTKADERLREGGQRLALNRLAKNIAYNIYVTTSRQLHLTHDEGSVIGGLTEDRGLRLAQAFDACVRDTSYDRVLYRDPRRDQTTRSVLQEIAEGVFLDTLPRAERDILIDAVLPRTPFDVRERGRLRHYALLLLLTRELARPVTEEDVFAASMNIPAGVPQCLQPALNHWLEYLMRDVLAVTHESVLAAVLREIDIGADERGAPPLASAVVAALLDQTEAHDEALHGLKLLKSGETIATLSFRELRERIRTACGNHPTTNDGFRRWRRGLTEVDVYERALQAGPAAPVFLPVAWCLVAERVFAEQPEGDSNTKRILKIGQIYQIGIEDVIFPKLDEFVHQERSVRDVIAELITRTVQQHLRVAWTRAMPAQSKDVSVILADGGTWARTGNFTAGRTDSRLRVAIDWLRQLRLINEAGLSSLGERIFARAIAALEGGES